MKKRLTVAEKAAEKKAYKKRWSRIDARIDRQRQATHDAIDERHRKLTTALLPGRSVTEAKHKASDILKSLSL